MLASSFNHPTLGLSGPDYDEDDGHVLFAHEALLTMPFFFDKPIR